jgi:hypothetical protein
MWTVPHLDGQDDVVVIVSFAVSGTDGDYTAMVTCEQQFTLVEGQFTPFDQLTQDQVIGWVQSALGESSVASIEISVQNQIDAHKNQPVSPAQQPLPWIS